MRCTNLYLLTFALYLLGFIDLKAQPNPVIYKNLQSGFTKWFKNTHDLALPQWGPYSDKYNGVSHIPPINDGIRFDMIVQPSFYMRTLTSLEDVKREGNYHPWQANADLSYFSYRYELEWKDQVYCDVSFSKVDDQSRLIKAEFVNNTNYNRSLALNIFNTIVYPYQKKTTAILPINAKWYKASGYDSFTDSVRSWNYNLIYNGQLRGQANDEAAVSRTSILLGKQRGEKLSYKIFNERGLNKGLIAVRYKSVSGDNTIIKAKVNGKALKTTEVQVSKEYSLSFIDVQKLPEGNFRLSFEILNKAPIRLDGFALVSSQEKSDIKFEEAKNSYVPTRVDCDLPNGIVLKYRDINGFYGMVWDDVKAEKRELFDDNPDQVLSIFNNVVKRNEENSRIIRISGNNRGWFNNIFSAPIILKPKQQVSRYAYIVYGHTSTEVIDKLKSLNKDWTKADKIYQNQQSKLSFNNYNQAGKPYLFSQQLMQATTFTNLIYPTFTANQYVKHTTPGKKWSSLYTWDSGFIGLGYAALNTGRAAELLNAYTMDESEQSAFLEHGTPLPVQGYLFNELWNLTQNKELLKYFYPRLKRFYDFLGGAESSTTRHLKSNMIKTWDIFYNSGGWDDYSPQVYVHKNKLQQSVAPTVNTAHQIRFAKLLKMAAWQLGYKKDIIKYDAEIGMYGKTLQQNSWDSPSGYFGYVKHNQNGEATGILRYADGTNFNMGIDGASPLIAGICTPNQQQKILKHLFTKGELWTDHGITAIDQSAPYYTNEGYWNGRVWMPHQWFFWKTMLDLNEPEKAIKIAQTALDVWKRETGDTYNCWENFSNDTGNGGGWHQFSALSSPVLNWYSALYKPGTFTSGFNIWPITHSFSPGNDAFDGKFKLFADQNNNTTTILLCLTESNEYKATCNGKLIPMTKVFGGFYFIKIQVTGAQNVFELKVRKV